MLHGNSLYLEPLTIIFNFIYHISDQHSIPAERAGTPTVSVWRGGHLLHRREPTAVSVPAITKQGPETTPLHCTGSWQLGLMLIYYWAFLIAFPLINIQKMIDVDQVTCFTCLLIYM